MNEVMGEWGKAKAKNIRVASVFIGVRARYRTFLTVGEARMTKLHMLGKGADRRLT